MRRCWWCIHALCERAFVHALICGSLCAVGDCEPTPSALVRKKRAASGLALGSEPSPDTDVVGASPVPVLTQQQGRPEGLRMADGCTTERPGLRAPHGELGIAPHNGAGRAGHAVKRRSSAECSAEHARRATISVAPTRVSEWVSERVREGDSEGVGE